MASRLVKFIWKFRRPNKPEKAWKLKQAAWDTIKNIEPDVCEILIRSGIHKNTAWGRKQDDPHITISTKNSVERKFFWHKTWHGYTVSLTDYEIIRVTPGPDERPFLKPDNSRVGLYQEEAWPRYNDYTEEDEYMDL